MFPQQSAHAIRKVNIITLFVLKLKINRTGLKGEGQPFKKRMVEGISCI